MSQQLAKNSQKQYETNNLSFIITKNCKITNIANRYANKFPCILTFLLFSDITLVEKIYDVLQCIHHRWQVFSCHLEPLSEYFDLCEKYQIIYVSVRLHNESEKLIHEYLNALRNVF